jgi:hypothetical protein
MVPRRPGTSPSPTCCCKIAIAFFWVPGRLVLQRDQSPGARQKTQIHSVFGDVERLQTVGERFLVARKQGARGGAIEQKLREVRPAQPFGWRSIRGCLALGDLRLVRLLAVEDRGDVGDRARRRNEGRANFERRIRSRGHVLCAAGAATPAACFCSSRSTHGRTMAPPHACRAFSSSGPIAPRGLPTLPRTQARSSSICACLHDSMICSCEAAPADE